MKKQIIYLLFISLTAIFLNGCVKDKSVEPIPPVPAGTIFLNEFLATSTTGVADWIEITNTSDNPINIRGFILSDSTRTSAWQPYVIGDVTIPAHGYKQFVNGTDFQFGLGSSGEGIRLYNTNWEVVDSYYWVTSQIADRTTGRIPDGTGTWTPDLTPTPGAANSNIPPPPPGQKLWLNEFLATSATAQPDWIELVNIGNDTINLRNYILSDSTRSSAWAPFIIGDVKIPPHGFKQFINGTDFTFGLGSTN